MYQSLYNAVATAKGDSFQGGTSDAGAVIAGFLAVGVVVVIQLFVIQFLWNAVLVPTVSVVRPLKTLVQTLGLLILVAMIHPSCVLS
jgi:hypothetical protein